MFLNIRTESVDNKNMKTLWKINTFLLLFTLTACMPDSLTKFKEEPTKKAEDTTSSGGSGGDDDSTPTPSTCSIGTDPLCTSPGPITFDLYEYETVAFLDGTEQTSEPIEPSFPSQIPGQTDFISFTSDDADFQTKTGLIFDPSTGIIGNSPSQFLPKTSFQFSAIYDTPELSSPETSSATLTFTTATDLQSVTFPTVVGQKLIVTLDDVSLFTTTAGFNNIVTASGAVGTISYIDEPNKEMHIDITGNSTGTGTIAVGDEVDNNTTFFSSRANVTKVYYAFDRTPTIQTRIAPNAVGHAPLVAAETMSLTYSIFPTLPTGLSFDQTDGTIGTLRGYQTLDDGTISTVTGSRTVTGLGTFFQSQLQVGSSVTINGELHQVESITSNTEFSTFLPLGSTITVGSIVKHIKGSLSLTNGSSTITGYGTDFSTEIVPTKGLVIDAVGTFTGLPVSLVTVVNATTLTLGANFTGTALTIPELKATTYLITAKNILNKSISSTIEFGLLDTIQPKTIGEINYTPTVNDKLVIETADATSFIKGGYVSSSKGSIATIDEISAPFLYVTLNNLGNRCTIDTYTTSGDCTTNNGEWISTSFRTGDELDNNAFFFAQETTVARDITRVYPVSPSAVTITPSLIPSGLAPAELATLTYTISPDISSGQGFCSNTTYKNEFDCTSNGGIWSQGLSFNTTTGVITGVINEVIPTTTFTITVENLLGRQTTTEVLISANEAPKGLAVTRNTLLHVPSNSAFEIGDAISSNNGAVGTVTGKFRINSANAEKGTFEFEFLEVRVETGTFGEFDDLDNIPLFASQKTYVLGSGTYHYNAKLKVATNTNSFKDPEYTTYLKNESLLQIGGADRAHVVFNDEVNDSLYVIAYDTATYAANIEPAMITTGDTITASNITGDPAATISTIEANNVKLNTDSAPTGLVSNTSKGHDITSTGDAGIGMLHHYFSSGGNFYSYVSVTEGMFTPGQDIQAISPFAASTATIQATGVSAESAIYFYRNVAGTAEVRLYSQDDSTNIELDKALPNGLTAEIVNGSVLRITGTPTGPSAKEKFTLTATNSFGSTSYEFFLKVYDQFLLVDTTNSLSYILHKTGKGNGRKPCSVTEEQMLYGDSTVKDISCFLDAGEDELHWNGVKMELQMGENLCQFVEDTPPAFWRFAAGNTSAELGVTIFQHTGFDSCTSAAPVGEYTTDAAGTALMSAIADPRILVPIVEPRDLCMFNYNHQYGDNDVPNCDDAEIPMNTVAWSPTPFECQTAGLLTTTDSTVLECLDNNGTCAGGTATGAETNRADCEAADPGNSIWTPNGLHNDGGGLAGPALGECVAQAAVPASNYNCAGNQRNCLAGARVSSTKFSTGDITDGVTTYISNMTATVPAPTTVELDYTSGYSGSDFSTNIWYSNYYSACGADLYKPDTTSQQTSIAATASTENFLGSEAQSTYQYVCKSGSGTIKARIRMIVRDFDRDFKVKLGYCANPIYTNQADCVDPTLGNTTWTASGIDYFNPDTVAGAPGAADDRHFLRNTQTDAFSDPYNAYDNAQSFIGGGYTCGPGANTANTVNFPLSGNTRFPERSL
jgi:hypothetical protein